MAQFFVVGGEYTDTSFCIADGGDEEWIGPFADYESAKKEWSRRAWLTVDECTTRFRIEMVDKDGPPPCTD